MTQRDNDLANAIESGEAQAVEQLLQQKPDLVNSKDWTPPPLHCAVLWNQPQIAELLLDSGADLEMRDPDRQTTPLRYAILYGKTDVIPVLLARGANTGTNEEDGSTAMELAIQAANGDFEEYEDLPSAAEYGAVIQTLRDHGVK